MMEKYSSPEQMKKDLIDFLLKDDVDIQTYMIRPDIQKIDISTHTETKIEFHYTGNVNIEIVAFKRTFEKEDEITRYKM